MKPVNYSLMELDIRSHEYIRQVLVSGKELSNVFINQFDLINGTVFTILPPHSNAEDVYDFEKGGKWIGQESNRVLRGELSFVPVSNTNELLVKLVNEFLKQYGRGTCVFEHAAASISDPFVQKIIQEQRYPVFSLDESVYYSFSARSSPYREQVLEEAIRMSHSMWHFLCAFSTYNLGVSEANKISPQEMHQLVANTQGIAVSAYDGESYLIWSGNSSFTSLLMQSVS